MNDMSAISILVDQELHVIVHSRKVHGDNMRRVAQLLWFLAWCCSGFVWFVTVFWSVTEQVALPAMLGTALLLIMSFLVNRFSPKLTPAEQKLLAESPSLHRRQEEFLWATNPANPASASYQSLHDRYSRH